MSIQPLPDEQVPRFARNEEVETATDHVCEVAYAHLIDRETGKINPQVAEFQPCPLCGQEDEKPYLERQGYTFVRCKHCGMIYMSPRLNETIYLNRLRSDENHRDRYHAILSQQNNDAEERVMKGNIVRLRASVPRGKLLDLGCGLGRFLLLARAAGYVVSGVEPHFFAASHARSNGLTIHEDPLEDLEYSPQSLDVVTAFDYLGRAQHPVETLKEIARILKPHGRLLLTCPNLDSMTCQLVGPDATDLFDAPDQINWFDRQSLAKMLRQAGFKIAEMTTSGQDDLEYLRLQFDRLEQPLHPFLHRIFWQRSMEMEEFRRDLQALMKRHFLGNWIVAECVRQ